MAPTEILAQQHYKLAIKLFKNSNINIELFTGKTDFNKKKHILKKSDLQNGKINLLFGTHAYFKIKLNF